MAQNIKLKRSAVARKVPTTAQLEAGELAINTVDGKLYFERDDATIQTILTTNAEITGSLSLVGDLTIAGDTVLTGSLILSGSTNQIVGGLEVYDNASGSAQSHPVLAVYENTSDDSRLNIDSDVVYGVYNTSEYVKEKHGRTTIAPTSASIIVQDRTRYAGLSIDYTLKMDTNLRAGHLILTTTAADTTFTDVSTTDIGDTTAVEFSASRDSGNIQVKLVNGGSANATVVFKAVLMHMLEGIPGVPESCTAGMDVVFVVDYTGSMGGAINGVKSSIADIVQTIITESGGDYRLGLVIFDEYTSGTTSNYSSKTAYTSLPANQKVVNTGLSSKYQWLTAVETMSTQNSGSFTTQLNLLNTTNFPLGSGVGSPEPGGLAVDRVINYDFAGTYRSNVAKLIVLITDNQPGGNDDIYNSTDDAFIAQLTQDAYDTNTQVLLMRTGGSAYDTLASGSNGIVSTNFNATTIQTAIEDLCTSNA